MFPGIGVSQRGNGVGVGAEGLGQMQSEPGGKRRGIDGHPTGSGVGVGWLAATAVSQGSGVGVSVGSGVSVGTSWT